MKTIVPVPPAAFMAMVAKNQPLLYTAFADRHSNIPVIYWLFLICRDCSNWGQWTPLRFPVAAELDGNAASYRVFAERGDVPIGLLG